MAYVNLKPVETYVVQYHEVVVDIMVENVAMLSNKQFPIVDTEITDFSHQLRAKKFIAKKH